MGAPDISRIKSAVQTELSNRVSDLGREVGEIELTRIIESVLSMMDLPCDLFLTSEARDRFSKDIVNDFLHTDRFSPCLMTTLLPRSSPTVLQGSSRKKGGRCIAWKV